MLTKLTALLHNLFHGSAKENYLKDITCRGGIIKRKSVNFSNDNNINCTLITIITKLKITTVYNANYLSIYGLAPLFRWLN